MRDWARSSDHRELVANYYLWEKEKSGGYSFLQFDPQEESFSEVACPARLGELCDTDRIAVPNGRSEAGLGAMRWRILAAPMVMVRSIFEPGPAYPPESPKAPAGLFACRIRDCGTESRCGAAIPAGTDPAVLWRIEWPAL